MQNNITYEFSVIRIVPKVEREEFINVGVLLFSKQNKFLGIRYKIDEARLKAFSNELDIDLLKEYLTAWQLICEGGEKAGEIGKLDLGSRFRWLSASKSTIIQCSKTHPGLCFDPKTTLEDTFKRFV